MQNLGFVVVLFDLLNEDFQMKSLGLHLFDEKFLSEYVSTVESAMWQYLINKT